MIKANKSLWFWIAGGGGFCAILLVSVRYITVFSYEISEEREAWGQFGDYFGGILNPLLSFSAYVTLLITLKFQMSSNIASEKRQDEQVREQRLFQLIGLVGQSAINTRYVSVYEMRDQSLAARGHSALDYAWSDLKKHRLPNSLSAELSPVQNYWVVRKEFEFFQKTAWSAISVFVESTFLLLEFVAKNGRDGDYFIEFSLGIIRSQLTEAERLLLWYSAICISKHSIFLVLFEKFDFLQESNSVLHDPLQQWRDKLVGASLIIADAENKPVDPLS